MSPGKKKNPFLDQKRSTIYAQDMQLAKWIFSGLNSYQGAAGHNDEGQWV